MLSQKTETSNLISETDQKTFVDVKDLRQAISGLKAGDRIYLSGEIFTARDAAHKRINDMLDSIGGNERDEKLPFDLKDGVIYYSGATPSPKNLPIGSCGPTTSSRMDKFAPRFYDLGVMATIGKGPRNSDVIKSVVRNGGIYLCAVGGAGALIAKSVISSEVVAFDDLGCESVKRLVVKDLPLFVGVDCNGGCLFDI